MTDDGVSDDEWREIAIIRHSVQGTRKQDVLEVFPKDIRKTISPSDIAKELDMRLSNVSRELRKLVDLELVEDLNRDKPNYKPFVITEKGLQIREIIDSTDSKGDNS